jgi:DNA-binding FadR family transcriptional regulator
MTKTVQDIEAVSRQQRILTRSTPLDRLHRDIAREIGVAIVGGSYGPGSVLPGEVAESERLGVSRAAYREAVRTLASKGLVESRPKIGTRVTSRSHWNQLDPDVVGWFFAHPDPDPSFLKGLFELRLIVEPAAAALAAGRRDSADIAQMREALEGMRTYTLANETGQKADRNFHEAILRASHNEVLVSLSAGITAAVLWTTLIKYRVRNLPRDPVADHRLVFDAIDEGNPAKAEDAMRTLVNLALRDMQESAG